MMTYDLAVAFFVAAFAMVPPLWLPEQVLQAVLIFLAILNFDVWVTQMRRRYDNT